MTGIHYTVLLILTFFSPAMSLRAGGRNVKTSYETYYVYVGTSTRTVTYRQTCTRTCATHFMWCWSKKTVCRDVAYYKWIPTYKLVARTRPVYSCYSGWRPNAYGSECTIPICTGGCQNGGVCIAPNRCRCTAGWTGSRCRSDVDECRTNQNSCTYKPGCRNTWGSYGCTCSVGYYLASDKRTCRDVDECLSGRHSCGANTQCVNNRGSYSCLCNRGFTYSTTSRKTCKDINECDPSSGIIHGCEGTCLNFDGGYNCSCPKGYYLTSNGKNCADHDDCAEDGHGCHQVCINYPGGYNCSCNSGYRLNETNHKSCYDVDECFEKISGCAHKCTNEMGSFKCSCNAGYHLGSDLKSCHDVDECSSAIHHCQHNCLNTLGDYNCNCRAGFDLLQDGRSCEGRPCFPIYSPVHGTMNCSGYTTERVCRFECSPGYDLIGSRNRTCSAMKTWTGKRTKCKIIHCPTPAEPWNGFLYSPCQTHFHSQCTVGCHSGYYIEGTDKITCDANGVWQPRNITCRAIKVCQPNPCLHGGICLSISSTQYSCDCTATGYKGTKCDVGHINTPNYPTLRPGVLSQFLLFQASTPSEYIVVTLVSRDIEFNPSHLVFNNGTSTSQPVTITARRPGLYFVRYLLSGPSAGEFQTPQENAILVISSENSTAETAENRPWSQKLPSGCYKQQLDKCPLTNDVIVASSTSPWVTFGPLTMTSGVVSLEIGATNVPLSVVGANIPNPNQISVPEQCRKEDVSYSTEQFISSRILVESFLNIVNDSLPKWLDITLRNNSFPGITDPSELQTNYLTGKLLRDADIGNGQPISDETFFSLILSQNLNLTIGNDTDVLGSANLKTSLAIDLCSSSPKNVILRPSLGDADLATISVVKILKENGWDFKFHSLQISRKKVIDKVKKGLFWNGKRFFEIGSSTNGSLAIVTSFSKVFRNSSFVRSGVKFEGTIIADIENIDNILDSPLDQEWKVDLYGDITLTMEFKVEGKMTKFTIKATQSIGYANFGGRINKSCLTDVNYDPHGLFFNEVLQEDPFVNSELSKYVEVGSNKTLAGFLDAMIYANKENNKSPYSERSDGVGLTFRGNFKFGPVRFDSLQIQLYVRNSDCSKVLTKATGSFESTGVELTGDFKETQTRDFGIFELPLGMFLNLQFRIAQNKTSRSTGSFQSIVKILGFEKMVNISMFSEGLTFSVSGKIHGMFDASMNCNSSLASWDSQIFTAVGEFADKSSERTLIGTLNEELNKYAVELLNKTLRRMDFSEEIEQRAKARIENVLLLKKSASEKVQRMREEYLIAERELDSAKKNLTYCEQAAKNFSNDVGELRSELDGLCLVKQCPDICQEGVVCTKCFEDIIGKTMGVCPATCLKTKQRRTTPYTETVLCKRDKCTRIHNTNGIFKTLLGKTFGNIVKKILSFGITSLATVVGVPPPIAAGLGSGIVTFLDTGRVDETMCSIGRGVVTGLIGGPGIKKALKLGVEKVAVALGRTAASSVVNKVISCQRDQRDGYWSCRVTAVECTKNRFKYEYEHFPYSCERSCEKYTVTKTIEKSCCSTLPCAFFVANLTCIAENSLCKKARKDALDRVSKFKANTAKILQNMEMARQNVSYWKLKKQKEHVNFIAASRSLKTSQDALHSLEKAYNITVEARKRMLDILAKPLRLRTLLDERLESVVMVKLDNIKFNVKVMAKDESTLLPIYVTFKINGTQEELSTVLDFSKLNASLRSVAKEILSKSVGDLSSVSRKKRSVEETRSSASNQKLSTLKIYHRLCSESTNYERTLHDVVGSLYNLSSEVLGLRQNARNRDESQSFNGSDVLIKFRFNKTMASKLGVDTTNVSYLDYLEEDPEVFEAKYLKQQAIQDGFEPLHLNAKYLLYNWFAVVEDIFNEFSGANQCSGLDDCIKYTLDSLVDIHSNTDLPGAQNVLEQIRDVEMKLTYVIRSVDMTVDAAVERSSEILQILENITKVNEVCARPPNITKHPEALTEMGVGEILTLTCNATGDFLLYKWRFNEQILQGQSTNVLLIENATLSHAGSYICEVSNHITKETSTPALVVIHPPPSIITQPVDYLSVVLSGDDSLQCQAESSDGNISYQWWFKFTNSTSFLPLINETFSYLNFAPMKSHQEGWYFCNVSNSYGFNLSTVSFVKALHFTLPVPAATISLSVVRRKGQNESFVKKSNSSSYEDIRSQIFAMLASFGNYSADTSKERIANLHPVNCQLKKTGHNKTRDAVEVCRWKLLYMGKNATTNSSVNEEFATNAGKVIKATLDVKQGVRELVNATNNGSLSFSLDNQTYFVEKYSLGVEDLSLFCSQSQALIQEDFSCVDCPPGFYGELDKDMSATCLPCPLGSYQNYSGQTSCAECPEGFTTVNLASYQETQCEVICPAGHYGVVTQNIGQCLPCPLNTYQPMKGQFGCLSCPSDRVTSTKGVADVGKCILEPIETTRLPAIRHKSKGTNTMITKMTGEPGEVNETDNETGEAPLIAGLVVVIVVIIIGLLLFFFYRRRRSNGLQRHQKEDQEIPKTSRKETTEWRDNPLYPGWRYNPAYTRNSMCDLRSDPSSPRYLEPGLANATPDEILASDGNTTYSERTDSNIDEDNADAKYQKIHSESRTRKKIQVHRQSFTNPLFEEMF